MTKGEWCGKIVKLSRKARHEKETGSRPREGIERSFGIVREQKQAQKDFEKIEKSA